MTPSITVPSGNSKLWYQPFRARSALKSFSFRRFSLSDNSCGAITHSYRSACIGSIHGLPLPAHHSPGLGAGMLAVANHCDPIDPHLRNPRRVLLRLFEGSVVLNRPRIEHYDIREVAFPQHSAPGDSEIGCRKGGHFAHGLLHGQPFLVAHVPRINAGEVAISSRVRARFQKDSVDSSRILVRREAHPRKRDLPPHVVFAHHEVYRPHPRIVLDYRSEE